MQQNHEDKSEKKGCFAPVNHREDKKSLKKYNHNRDPVDSGNGCQLEDPEIFILAISEKSPRKARKKMGENIFESYPDKRGQKKYEAGEGFMNFGEAPGKKSPIQGKVKNEDGVDQQTNTGR
jgi:hypothetical protein